MPASAHRDLTPPGHSPQHGLRALRDVGDRDWRVGIGPDFKIAHGVVFRLTGATARWPGPDRVAEAQASTRPLPRSGRAVEQLALGLKVQPCVPLGLAVGMSGHRPDEVTDRSCPAYCFADHAVPIGLMRASPTDLLGILKPPRVQPLTDQSAIRGLKRRCEARCGLAGAAVLRASARDDAQYLQPLIRRHVHGGQVAEHASNQRLVAPCSRP